MGPPANLMDYNLTLEECLRNAIQWSIDNDVMADYFIEHREEVVDMIIEGPWDWEMAMKVREQEHEEELAEAKVKGRAEGRVDAVRGIMESLNLSFDKAADIAKIEETEREQIRAMI